MPMPTPSILATGLAGAIGSHFHAPSNRLYFVEYGGRLSRYDLVRSAAGLLLNNAARTLQGTYLMNLDNGVQGSAGGDIWWEQIDAVQRRMVPRNGATIAYLGVMTAAQFNALGVDQLQALDYGSTPIVGDAGAANRLVPNAVFAVRTDSGNLAKLRVMTYGYDLSLRITTWRLNPAYQVLGTGYGEPEDVKVSADGRTAWITERGGRLLRVALNGTVPPHRSAAAVVASGLQAPHQIALCEDEGSAYVVEYAASGHLVRVNLASGAATRVAFNLQNAIGLLVDADRRQAFVSEQLPAGGRVRRVDLASGLVTPVVDGLQAPFMMAFADATETALLIAERDPANRVSLIDLGTSPPQRRVVAGGLPPRPSSVALASPTRLLVCCDTQLAAVELAPASMAGTGPLLLGIGHVPVDRIVGGYADTTTDPAYFFQRKDCPFGGSLPVMVNHERARAAGAAYYRVVVDGNAVKQPLGDFLWNAGTQRFEHTTVLPDANGHYPVRAAGQLWYHAWLGLLFDSTGLANGAHTLRIELANAAKAPIAVPAGVASATTLQIDNSVPLVEIRSVSQAGTPIGACAVVTTGPDRFAFEITASDPEGHLANWSLTALWGDNRSALIAADSYAAHASPSRQWAGLVNAWVPGAPPAGGWASKIAGDPSAGRCAYTFVLSAWDRVIDGWSDLHHRQVHKSLTIWLP